MNRAFKILKIFIGSLIIALTINIFFVNFNIIPSGMFGFGILFSYKTHMELFLIISIINGFFLLLTSMVLEKKYIIRCLITFWLIPLLIYGTKDIANLINIQSADKFLISIYGGLLMGLGYRIIYKENNLISSTDLVNILEDKIFYERENYIIWVLNTIWLLICYFYFGLESVLYSLLSILIMENLSKRINLGISEAKVFYIITSKEAKIKKYIIDELKYNLTVLEVKGGFTGNKNKVLMCVVQTYDYYKLKEGIKYIDPNAFISITDSYEAINGSIKYKSTSQKVH